MVQLFQNYRIIGSADVQMLGDLFEQLLNKGFKQNEGQFSHLRLLHALFGIVFL